MSILLLELGHISSIGGFTAWLRTDCVQTAKHVNSRGPNHMSKQLKTFSSRLEDVQTCAVGQSVCSPSAEDEIYNSSEKPQCHLCFLFVIPPTSCPRVTCEEASSCLTAPTVFQTVVIVTRCIACLPSACNNKRAAPEGSSCRRSHLNIYEVMLLTHTHNYHKQ